MELLTALAAKASGAWLNAILAVAVVVAFFKEAIAAALGWKKAESEQDKSESDQSIAKNKSALEIQMEVLKTLKSEVERLSKKVNSLEKEVHELRDENARLRRIIHDSGMDTQQIKV